MTRILLSVFFLFSLGACKQNVRTVVVAGDSWAFFVCTILRIGQKKAERWLANVRKEQPKLFAHWYLLNGSNV